MGNKKNIEVSYILELKQKGMLNKEIAQELGVNPVSISRVLSKNGLQNTTRIRKKRNANNKFISISKEEADQPTDIEKEIDHREMNFTKSVYSLGHLYVNLLIKKLVEGGLDSLSNNEQRHVLEIIKLKVDADSKVDSLVISKSIKMQT